MDYIEVTITGFTNFDPGIVIAQMAELGFESFTESDEGIQCYVRDDLYDREASGNYLERLAIMHGLHTTVARIADQNWNALWESAYQPVTIAGRCHIRAPFHPVVSGMEFEIIIEPRMSFGTAHHSTTAMMLNLLMEEEVKGKRILDMGCGTGVLALLSYLMGGAEITAIDNDEWAFYNAADNFERNGAKGIHLIRGEAGQIPGKEFDLILANINRNVLLQDMPVYAAHLAPSGTLLVSGFYAEDLDQVRDTAQLAGLHYHHHIEDHNWIGARFRR